MLRWTRMTLADTKGVLASIMKLVPRRQSPYPSLKYMRAGNPMTGTRMWWKTMRGRSMRNWTTSPSDTVTVSLGQTCKRCLKILRGYYCGLNLIINSQRKL